MDDLSIIIPTIPTQIFHPNYENVFDNEDPNKRPQLLVTMAIGLIINSQVFNRDAVENKDFLPGGKAWKPNKESSLEEMKRRRARNCVKSSTYFKDKRMNLKVKYDWLTSNPITNEDDIDFVTDKMEQMIELHQQAQHEKGLSKVFWKGLEPVIRFIHCLTDFDDIKEAFRQSLTCMTRQELDGKNNPQIGRADPWELIAAKWNDTDFYLKSVKYPHLHSDFAAQMSCDHRDVSDMGLLTPEKAKERFLKLKMQVVTVRTKWLASGNGEGMMRRRVSSSEQSSQSDGSREVWGEFSQYDRDDCIDANDKKNFLNGYSPSVLYFWERAEESDLLENVCQQLSEDCGFDTSDNSSTPVKLKTKKRKQCHQAQ